jgi:hypothetical protein
MKDKLTIEAFAATLMDLLINDSGPRWLCMNDEEKQKRLERLNSAYQDWIKDELKTADVRTTSINQKMKSFTRTFETK